MGFNMGYSAASQKQLYKLINRVQESPLYDVTSSRKAPYGFYGERAIIGPETDIVGGVYLGGEAHEAVVIDESYGTLESVFQRHITTITNCAKRQEVRFIEGIFAIAQEILPVNRELFESLYKQQKLNADQKISLDAIIHFGAGLERHQVLLASYLINKCLKAGILKGGKISLFWESDCHSESIKLSYRARTGRIIQFDAEKIYKKIPKSVPFLIAKTR